MPEKKEKPNTERRQAKKKKQWTGCRENRTVPDGGGEYWKH
jgi:hypothetical protein